MHRFYSVTDHPHSRPPRSSSRLLLPHERGEERVSTVCAIDALSDHTTHIHSPSHYLYDHTAHIHTQHIQITHPLLYDHTPPMEKSGSASSTRCLSCRTAPVSTRVVPAPRATQVPFRLRGLQPLPVGRSCAPGPDGPVPHQRSAPRLPLVLRPRPLVALQ